MTASRDDGVDSHSKGRSRLFSRSNRSRDTANAAQPAATRFEQRFSLDAWREQHLYGLFSSLGALWRRRTATLLTVSVMGLALLLPLLLQVTLRNLEGIGADLRDAREISAFLVPRASKADVENSVQSMRAVPGVASVAVRTPQDALDELRNLEGFAGAAALLDDNPLPHVLQVAPAAGLGDAELRNLATRVEAVGGVEFVQYDLAWRDRFGRVLALAERIALVAGLVFALAALLVVGNTIRLDVAARASEIAIVQLLGGNDAFVRRPFLYAGIWYGLFAAALAVVSALAIVEGIRLPTLALAENLAGEFVLRGISVALAAATLAAGAMLGWLGAWAACSGWLARGRPQ